METIETRLRCLERQNRNYRNWFILAGLALVAVLGYGAAEPVPVVIQARRFEVVNEAGKIVFHAGSNQGAGFVEISTKYGKTVAILSADEAGTGGLALLNKGGKPVTLVAVDDNGNGSLWALNNGGRPAVGIGISPNGGFLSLYGNTSADGSDNRLSLTIDEVSGSGLLTIKNKEGKRVVFVGSALSGGGQISVLNKTGVIVDTVGPAKY